MNIKQEIENAKTVAELRTLRLATKAAIQAARADIATLTATMIATKDAHTRAQEILTAYGEAGKLKTLFYCRLGELTKDSIDV